MAADLCQFDRLRRGGTEVQAKGHGVQMTHDDSLDVAANARAGNGLGQHGNIGQSNLCHAFVFDAILIDSKVDNSRPPRGGRG